MTDWQARITLNGVDYTSPRCDSKSEAAALLATAKQSDDVSNAEVEEI